MSARIWAWTGLFAVACATDMVTDLVLRPANIEGTSPTSWDAVCSLAMFLALVGLGRELWKGWDK